MPNYLAPGVYVEEVPSAIQPIAGVGTSTAGFIGLVTDAAVTPLRPGAEPLRAPETDEVTNGKLNDGVDLHKKRADHPDDFYPLAPAGEPQLITSWSAFVNAFGDVQDGNRVLAQAVYGFFNNGGTRCHVIRFAPASDDTDETGDTTEDPTKVLTKVLIEVPTEVPAPVSTVGLEVALEDAKSGLESFAAIDEIALVAIPGTTADLVQGAVLDHCEGTYLQDRFAILDGKPNAALSKAGIQGAVRDSSYGAIYFPWIDVGDRDPTTKAPVHAPPSGHIAGVYARVDANRGVHKAPANEVIFGAAGVATRLSRADQAGLNPDDINVIRQFDGNITVWGAHTLAGKESPEWRYVNVRRLFLFLRESIDEGTRWAVFEPNSPELWSKIRRNVGAFLTTVWSSGALFGTKPEEAFYVRCDETTNPLEIREQGQVVTEIGVAVVKPAEFVVFRISQWAGAGS